MNEIHTIRSQIESLVNYMRSKVDQRDWHAVADAAMDIRELEAKIKVYELVQLSKTINERVVE